MAPYQTTVMLDDTRDGQDVVEVQILPQVIIIQILFSFVNRPIIIYCVFFFRLPQREAKIKQINYIFKNHFNCLL